MVTPWARDLIGTRQAPVAFGLALAVVGLALAAAVTEHRRQAGA